MRDLPKGTVTLLFTDIEGSTHLLRQLGGQYAGVLADCRHLLRHAFQTYSGQEVDTQGDAFFVAFSRASDAVSAAVAAQRALASHSWPQGVEVRVRMGLHTGEPSLISEGFVGLDVHRAARIMSAGHGGQVLLSQTTQDLVQDELPDGVQLRDLGEHRLKDLQRPSRLYQLVMVNLPADFPPLKTLESHPNNLPVQLTPLIGREQEVAAVQNLLKRENVRLLTLTGPGGTGKTRLGLQVAAELCDWFPDGLYFVNLAPTSDPAFVIPTLAQALGLREVAGQPLLEHMKGELHQKQLLVVLDNFEQVVRAAPQLVDLLAACPKLKLLVTSREVLHVHAEHEFAVPPLALPDPTHLPALAELSHYAAVMLFIERAQAARPEFQLTTANAQAIAEICVHLDGLPLAIELAAARINLLPPQALLARLGQRLLVLTSKAQDVPARHQTLHNTIAWSYQLLDAQEQRFFRRLSVFVGGCTLEAIEAVCAAIDKSNGAGWVLDAVDSLIDKSLLQRTEQEEEPRLVMLETIREYGWEVLAASGELEASRQAHAHYYLQLAEEAERELEGLQAAIALERLEREHDNLRAVMQWSLERDEMGHRIEMALHLGATLQQFWKVRGHWREGRNFLEQALVKSEGIEAPVRVKALLAAARLASVQGDLDRTEALSEESLAQCREVGDKGGIALSLSLLWDIAYGRGDLEEAYTLAEEALALFKEVGDKEGVAQSLANLAHTVSDQGEYARGIALHEEALALWREAGDIDHTAKSHCCLAEMHFFSQSDPVTVHTLLEKGLALSKELGHKEGIAWSLALSGQLALSQRDEALARSLVEESLALYREMGHLRGIARWLFELGRVAVSLGDYAAARARYEESLAIEKVVGNNRELPFYLEGLASLFVERREPVRAVRLWSAADALRAAMGTPIPPVYRADYDRSVAAARNQLDEQAFAAAWAEGQTIPLEQVIDDAVKMLKQADKQ